MIFLRDYVVSQDYYGNVVKPVHIEFRFFDNYFPSYDLMKYLSEHEILATGSIKENRITAADLVLFTNTHLKNEERGTYNFLQTIRLEKDEYDF